MNRVGNYELLERIGAGGMGEVWRARQRGLGREVAVKLVREPDKTLLGRFVREARAAAALRSPHNIQVLDFGSTPDGRFFAAMELLDGLDLHQLVERFGPQPVARAAGLLRQACEALGEAHRAGLVHRDVKPSNLFVCRLGEQVEFLKVLDYGLVLAPASPFTVTGVVPGSPAWMAPELIRGGEAADKADVYGLGAVFYWLLTGRPVFEGQSAFELLAAQLERPAPSPSARVAVPAWVDEVVAACLSKDPAARPSAAELRARLVEEPWDAPAWWARNHSPRPFSLQLDSDPALVDASPAARQQVYEALKSHFDQSHIDLGEYERRLGVAQRAATPMQLDAALQGLPQPTALAPAPAPAEVALPDRSVDGQLLPAGAKVVAVFGASARSGQWDPGDAPQVTSVFGEIVIDLREVRLPPGPTVFRCAAVFGSIRFILPPGLYAESSGVGVLGNFDGGVGTRPPPGSPWVEIKGAAVFGEVKLRVKAREGEGLAGVIARGAEAIRDALVKR